MRFRAGAWVITGITSLVLLSASVLPQEQQQQQEEEKEPPQAQQQAILALAKEVRRQIVRLPQYGVFDNIHFAIQGSDTVILRGQASRPTLRSSAENVVKRIDGVKNVTNEIEVLPTSPNDDRIRAAVYRSIYGFAPLQRYTSNRGRGLPPSIARRAGGITMDPPIGWHAIHIIVRNGHVTLEGVVDSDADLAMAGMRANLVPGVFSVDNNLQVAGRPANEKQT